MVEKDTDVLELIKRINSDLEDKEDMKVWEQLMKTQPFSYYEDKIAELEVRLNTLTQVVDMLRKHQHTNSGETCVPL